MRRRTLLASGGIAAMGLLGGCVGAPRETPPRLGWVGVHNYSSEARRFRVEILREADVVHESTHEIEGRSEDTIPGEVLECTWGEEPGPYTIRARVDGGEWVEQSIADAIEDDPTMEDPDCVVTTVQYMMGISETFTFRVRDTCGAVSGFDGGCSFANSET
ncbi:MAG: hypothetical protein ABEH66_06530 [Halobacteriales archaeon]